jgi:hypothetical protein
MNTADHTDYYRVAGLSPPLSNSKSAKVSELIYVGASPPLLEEFSSTY